jgi:NAD(P)H-quinone oxidoreductase subunit 4L
MATMGSGEVAMSIEAILIVASALIGIGLYGALSQQSFVMLMMGLELMLNGVLLAAVGFWSLTAAGVPEGQLLAIVTMAVMAVEMSIGFALVVAVYRKRQADVTEGITALKH